MVCVRSVVALVILFAVVGVAPVHADHSGSAIADAPKRPSRIEAIRRGIARHLGLRQSVRYAVAKERTQVKLGKIAGAATTVTETRERIQPMGLRERLTLWASKRNVTRSAFRMADQRSKVGDTAGAREALGALDTLQASGRARAENRAFKNALDVARRAAGKRTIFEIVRRTQHEETGNLDLGIDNLNFASELAKKNGKSEKVARMTRTFINGGMKLAAKQAKIGNTQSAWQLLEKAAVAAERGGVEFPESAARRILVKGFEVNAKQMYKAGAHDDAAASLYQAMALRRSVGDRPTRGARKLEQNLLPRIRELVAAERVAAETAAAPTTTGSDAAPSLARPQNPILAENLPDPAIVKTRGKDGGYFMVGTAGTPGDRNRDSVFTIKHSSDLSDWKASGSVFAPGRWPEWAKGDFWAPEIHQVGDKFVAYYTARDHKGRLSIGAAWANDVRGPYTDLGEPLIRDRRTGVIDSNFFRDDKGQPHLVWKLDGNDVGKSTPIYIQRLSPDGMKLQGARHKLLTNDQSWEGPLVEAPWVVKRNGYYYMFYSGNMYNTDRYATGVARSKTPYGPYEKMPEPVLRSNGEWAGPGHGAIVKKGGKDYYVYHAWKADKIGDPNPRMVLMDPVRWENGWPKIGNGTPSGTVSPERVPTP